MALLEPFDILNAILQTIFIITTITIGLIIASKYSIHKDRVFLMVGFAWIGLVEPWMASVSNFFYVLITGRMFDVRIYLLIGMTFIPLSLTFWFVAITDLMYKQNQKLILSIIITYGILFEIYFLYYIFNDPSVLAVLHGVIDIEYKLPLQLYVFSVLVLSIITGLLFSRTSIKSENPEVQLRQHDESALLWGDYKEALGRWQEDRVGWANLDYPVGPAEAKKEGKRVWLHYTVLSDGGQIAFVWWKEVKDHGKEEIP